MLEQQQPFDLSFTIAIVGDASTGKSTLVHQETTSFFSQGGAAYVERGISEVSIEDKIYRVNDSRCLVHFVDVPGADRFARLSCRFAAGAIFMAV